MTEKQQKTYSLNPLPDHKIHKQLDEYYSDKTVWIIGGSEGIGAFLAKYLILFGANVLIISRHQSKLDTAINQMKDLKKSTDQRLQSLSLDITNYSKVEESLNTFIKKNGCMDIVINCAGYSHPGFLQKLQFKPSMI